MPSAILIVTGQITGVVSDDTAGLTGIADPRGRALRRCASAVPTSRWSRASPDSVPGEPVVGAFFTVSSVMIVATTARRTGHGLRFVTDPTSTNINVAQSGSERNGVWFS